MQKIYFENGQFSLPKYTIHQSFDTGYELVDCDSRNPELSKNDCAIAINKDTILQVKANCARKYNSF